MSDNEVRICDWSSDVCSADRERARAIFGTCLLQLTQLRMKQAEARSMLGKWRSQAGDDDTLIRVVAAAHKAGTPDPVSYITKALAGSQERTEKVAALQKAEWSLLGWEPPTYVRSEERGVGKGCGMTCKSRW